MTATKTPTTTARHEPIPADFPVQPVPAGEAAEAPTTCGHCGLTWDDAIVTSWTPAPSARCPFEYFHLYPEAAPAAGKAGKADTIQIHKAAAIKLFTDWHVDEGTSRAEARNYARRLWTRLEQEATEAGIAMQARKREAERKARAAQPKTLSLHDTIALHHALAPTEATTAHMAALAKKGGR